MLATYMRRMRDNNLKIRIVRAPLVVVIMFPLRLLPGVKTGYLVTLWVTMCLGKAISNGLVQCRVCRVTC